MIRVGVTGNSGFIGSHLVNTMMLTPERYRLISFERNHFLSEDKMDAFVRSCDVIVHLAGVNRASDQHELYEVNLDLSRKLVDACERTASRPRMIMSSSIQEGNGSIYGKAKKESREILEGWARSVNGSVTTLIIPNVFGPFGRPFYNSVVATFCHQFAIGEEPTIQNDAELNLIYVAELVAELVTCIDMPVSGVRVQHVTPTAQARVSDIYRLLKYFYAQYVGQGNIPELHNAFELNLFNTFRSFVPFKLFPRKLTQHKDDRGFFSEIIRLGTGGQVSYSLTHPGITRGNHFHTRKIERFTVIRGKARLELRKFNTPEIIAYEIDGNEPAYVDMPVWYTHNITNIGTEDLITIFWINEPYDPANPDTYLEKV